jgi:PTS system galactitol-specific IIA component
MQHTLLELLHAENMLVGLEPPDAPSSIRALNDQLVRSGKTLPAYADDAAAREATFPTGLPTQPVAVAIPHASPANVLASALGIATLRAPVVFAQMGGDGSIKLDVFVIVLLAVKEQEKQVEMIQQLMKVIQNQTLLAAMTQVGSTSELLDLILQTIQR